MPEITDFLYDAIILHEYITGQTWHLEGFGTILLTKITDLVVSNSKERHNYQQQKSKHCNQYSTQPLSALPSIF